MRKVLSFVLVLALVLGSFSMAFAAPFSDMDNEASSEAVSVLKDLGVVAGYPDGTFRPDQIVTRAEMARFIVAALGLEQFAVGTTSKYPDMVQAPWAQGVVAYGTSLGFISGYPDGTFKPNQQVSFQEAASMLVRALGYTEAFLPGGWPAEWMIKANSLGIFDDVTMASGAAGADRGAIAQMLYNALELEIGQVNNDNVWNAFVPSDTMLKRLGATFLEAFVVTGAEDTLINLRPYVGKYVTAYENKDGDILTISEVKSTTLKGKFTTVTDGAVLINDGNVFEADDVKYTVNVTGTTDAALFMSNGDIADFGLDKTTTFTLEVKLSGKVIQDVYSVAKWSVSANDMFVVKDLDLTDKMRLLGKDFILDNNDDVDMMSFELVGAKSLSDIAVDDVVYVYVSTEGIRKIAVGTKVVEGEITRVAGSPAKYTVNGVAYEMASGFTNTNPTDAGVLEVKNEVSLYLDAFGKIYFAEKISGEKNTAMLLNASYVDSVFADSKAQLFLADGTTKTFVVDIDEVDFEPFDGGKDELVKYSVNSDGEIDSLTKETIADIYADATISKTGFLGASGETTYKVSADALIFADANVDSTTSYAAMVAADGYSIAKLADLLDKSGLTVAFVLKDNVVVTMIVEGAGLGSDAVFGVIQSNYVSSDDPRGVVWMVNGSEVEKNAATVLTVNATTDKLLYKITFNTNGDAVWTDAAGTYGIGSTTYTGITITNGIAYVSPTAIATIASDVIVYVYNSDNDWEVGDVDDIELDSIVKFFDTDTDDGVVLADTILVY